jgi:hypothetical protein
MISASRLLLAAAIATLSLPAMAEVPVPRPKPCTALTQSRAWLAEVGNYYEEMRDQRAQAFIERFNAVEPVTNFVGDRVLAVSLPSPGSAVYVGIFAGECQVYGDILKSEVFEKIIAEVQRILV